MKAKTYRRIFNIATPISTFLLSSLTIANVLVWPNSGVVSQFLGQESFKKVNTSGEVVDSEYYKSDYKKLKQVQKDETAYAQDVQAEGTVLLQNNGLPLKENSKITLLGYSCTQQNFLVGGGGSGSIDTSKTPSLFEVFENAGYEVNETMWDFYTNGNGKASYAADQVNEPALSKYGETEFSSFSKYNDAAIVIISRKGSEGSDIKTSQKNETEKSMLELSENEKALISKACDSFGKVILLLNTSNPLELGDYGNNEKISILWVGAGGQQGLRAIPEIINGIRYPSGRLVDTYAYDEFSSPAMQNFGDYTLTSGEKYVNYAEGIYVGYKYYETRYDDAVNHRENVGEYNYKNTVQFPFGYGLSYADFSYSDFKVIEEKDDFKVSVKVTNLSKDQAGKEVVQVYMQSPYTQYDIENGIEKSAIQLVGFAKTMELEGGMDEVIEIDVPKSVMKAYDSKNAKTYIVDEGDYYFSIGKNAHDALNNILTTQSKTIADGMTENGDASFVYKHHENSLDKTTYSKSNGNDVTNQFDDVDYRSYDDSFKYLTRNNWTGTMPKTLGNGTLETTDKMARDLQPKESTLSSGEMPKTGSKNDIVLAELIGKDFNDEKWNLLLDNLTADEMMQLVGNAGYGTIGLPSIGKPGVVDKDGPAGISSSLIGGIGCFGFPTEMVLASTWNTELAEKMGYFIGEDSLYSGVPGWYAPSMNIHRTPFSGRNFEYYSEDGFISGIFGAKVTKAAQEKGTYCYIKHFVLNDQEQNRGGIVTWSNEQALREIYLEPFENAVKEGKARGLMVAMNRIGCTWVGAHKGLLTNVLRNEWGYDGAVITDAAMSYDKNMDLVAGLSAGTDIWLCPTNKIYTIDTSKAENVIALRNASHRILFVVANSNAMNGIDANVRIISVITPWQIGMIILDIVVYAGGVFLIAFSAYKWFKQFRKEVTADEKN